MRNEGRGREEGKAVKEREGEGERELTVSPHVGNVGSVILVSFGSCY